MDLWIRSQDKESLTKVSNVQYTYKKGDLYTDVSGQHYIGTYYDNLKILGTYKTKERALEVLDEIHSCIQTNAGFEMYSNLGQFSDDFNKKYNLVPVYLMPKE